MRERGRRVRAAFACALAAVACSGQPAAAQPADAPVAAGLRIEPAPGAAREDAGGFGWGIAPIRWGGNLSSELRVVDTAERPRRVQRVDSVDTRAATYVWQPWFAQVSGGLGVLGSNVLSGGDGAANGPMGADPDSTAVTGHGALSVFPASRFPFQARFERTDSRTGGELTSTDFTTTRAGVRQDYRPNGASTNYSFSRDRSVLESGSLGRDTLDVWEARVAGQSGPQNYDFAANHSRNSRSTDGESRLDRVSARHSYREGARLSVESLASANNNEFSELGPGITVARRTRLAQLSSFAYWRPAEGSPWSVTGGARVFQTEVEEAGGQSETRTLSANLGANYQLSRRTTFSGIASITEVLTETRRDVISTQGASVTHVPDAIPLGAYLYSRNLSAGLSNQNGGPEGDRRGATAQFGHSLSRSVPLEARSTLGLNVTQNLAAADDTLSGSSTTLLHSAGLTWSGAPSERSSAYAALSAADSRRRGADENHFQLVNLQVNGQFQFSRYASATASFTTQATRADSPQAPGDGFDVNASGNLAYQHARAFGVAGLRYAAIYSANDSQLASRRLGDLNAPLEQASQSLEQRLEYSIGRLEARLLARVAEVQGERNALVFLRLSRRFGNF